MVRALPLRRRHGPSSPDLAGNGRRLRIPLRRHRAKGRPALSRIRSRVGMPCRVLELQRACCRHHVPVRANLSICLPQAANACAAAMPRSRTIGSVIQRRGPDSPRVYPRPWMHQNPLTPRARACSRNPGSPRTPMHAARPSRSGSSRSVKPSARHRPAGQDSQNRVSIIASLRCPQSSR